MRFGLEPMAEACARAAHPERAFPVVHVAGTNGKGSVCAMVEAMVETGRMSGGYMMCIGNHIPWNVPPEAVKLYFDLSAELGYR